MSQPKHSSYNELLRRSDERDRKSDSAAKGRILPDRETADPKEKGFYDLLRKVQHGNDEITYKAR
jgi:hypothetical protein